VPVSVVESRAAGHKIYLIYLRLEQSPINKSKYPIKIDNLLL